MLGKRSAVAIQIYKEQLRAHYTHCHCYSLNLSIKDVTRSSKMFCDVMGNTWKFLFLSSLPQNVGNFWKTLRNNLKIVKKSPQIKSQNFLPQDGQ